jgi:hypothetical protein
MYMYLWGLKVHIILKYEHVLQFIENCNRLSIFLLTSNKEDEWQHEIPTGRRLT